MSRHTLCWPAVFVAGLVAHAQSPEEFEFPGVEIDENVDLLIEDRATAIKLGKAFFWDTQTGGDGRVACATCHYHAGVDNRIINMMHPGPDGTFQTVMPGGQILAEHFPFHAFEDPNDEDSTIIRSWDDIYGSQGVLKTGFLAIIPGSPQDAGFEIPDPIFHDGVQNRRQVTGRSTPSTINAVFNRYNFWDGRANNRFNGVSQFGDRDTDARIWIRDDDEAIPRNISLRNSSVASQAVGPPNDKIEMSFDGRSFPELGEKLLSLQPLAQQSIHPEDSVFSGMIDESGYGLTTSYTELIQNAFFESLWSDAVTAPDGTPLIRANFTLFWALSIQEYLATLISDQTRFDDVVAGRATFTSEEQRGFDLFMDEGKCISCHSGALFSGATIRETSVSSESPGIVNRMEMAHVNPAVYDEGFYNIGVRPTADDPGRGGDDPFGNPLSYSLQLTTGNIVDPIEDDFRPCNFEVDPCVDVMIGESTAVQGAFKVPILRNVELTGPYMHNGSMKSLEEVILFYARGANFENFDDLDPDVGGIETLLDDPSDQAAMKAFLETLTDERVRDESAPFDHPEILLVNGERIPAIGAGGRSSENLPPLRSFDATLQIAAGAGACCLPDATCIQVGSLQACLDAGGMDVGAIPDCGLVICEAALPRACCFPDGSCIELPPGECEMALGQPQGLGVGCLVADCSAAPTEACCFPGLECLDLTDTDCLVAGGTSQGPGSSCDLLLCKVVEDPQACCLADGSCLQLTPDACQDLGGEPAGIGSECETSECGHGACCVQLPDTTDNCVEVSQTDCTKISGDFQGAGTTCAEADCPEPVFGACCFSNDECVDTLPESLCELAGADFIGEGTQCTEQTCIEPPCPADLNGNGLVGVQDLVILIQTFGPCQGSCPADLNEDGVVDTSDLIQLMLAWGPC